MLTDTLVLDQDPEVLKENNPTDRKSFILQ